jgi:[pyruvate, water dikinase]-phosphate phosphotransferase / [pyruvate, water dikinase] kinase
VTPRPTIFALSDSLGETAEVVARAAASQFEGQISFTVKRLKVTSASQVRESVNQAADLGAALFYTLAEQELRDAMRDALADRAVPSVDILGPAIETLIESTEEKPQMQPGIQRRVSRSYFRKIEALEFAVNHDDGRHPDGLRDAEIILIGVSRTSKTPLSVYLSYRGYKVANVPLITGVDPPTQLFEPLRGLVVGLVGDAEILAAIRRERMQSLGSSALHYADIEAVTEELAYARNVMRKIGCPVVKTTQRAIEETAEEILRYLS